jgi:hypothetical protein
MLAGYVVKAERESGDKITRADERDQRLEALGRLRTGETAVRRGGHVTARAFGRQRASL